MKNNLYSPDLVQAFPYVENGGLTVCIASLISHMYASCMDFYYIDNNVWTKQTDILGMSSQFSSVVAFIL